MTLAARYQTDSGLSHNVMAVDPHSLTVPPSPMSWPPDIIRAAYVVARAANIIRSIANLDCDGARITAIIRSPAVIRSTTIVRSVTRVGTVIPFTAYCAERRGDQSEPENKGFRFHIMVFRIGLGVYASAFDGSANLYPQLLREPLHNALIEHRVRDFHEAGDVRTDNKITRLSVLLRGFPGVLEDRGNDVAQT